MVTVSFSFSAGTFFNFEISPILVVHSETRQSFAHFLTSSVTHCLYHALDTDFNCFRTCAIVGGVLTVASLFDSILFATGRALKKSGNNYGGKLM